MSGAGGSPLGRYGMELELTLLLRLLLTELLLPDEVLAVLLLLLWLLLVVVAPPGCLSSVSMENPKDWDLLRLNGEASGP